VADLLVGIQQLGAIEVNYDPPPFGPPFEEIIPLLRKIQEKKPLIVLASLTEEEWSHIMRVLPSSGLLMYVEMVT
jgi:hypothetical protein